MPIISRIVSAQFTRDENRDMIKLDHTLTPSERYQIFQSGWTTQDLESCVAMVPIKYQDSEPEFKKVLPVYLPVYSYEWGRSKYIIQRRYQNDIISIHLVSDANFASWAVQQADPYNI